jgi:HSP20 family protein
MQRELERLVGRGPLTDGQRIGGGVYPSVNVLNGPREMVVQAELAGVRREDIDLSITGETLVITGNKKPLGDEETIHYQRRERGSGEFSRTIVLPDAVEAEKVNATLSDGILTIRLPKAEAALPRQIEVK